MSICNLSLTLLHFPMLLISIIFILSSIISSATDPLNFNFASFDPNNHDIHVMGNATISKASAAIELTSNQQDLEMDGNTGRATYNVSRFHLWDKATGTIAAFTTNFSFVIDSRGSQKFGDGLAFFIADPDFTVAEKQEGGSIGLVHGNQWSNDIIYPFVAVEFDTFPNEWDPPFVHVGININSMSSVKNFSWSAQASIVQGYMTHAWIRYNSSTKLLSVSFTEFSSNGSQVQQNMDYQVDLTRYLPEWVQIGFSAATGDYYEVHAIHSWSFNSTVIDGMVAAAPLTPEGVFSVLPPVGTGLTRSPAHRRASTRNLVIGLSIGCSCLILFGGMISLWFGLSKRRNRMELEDESTANLSIEFGKTAGPRKFSFATLARATNKFGEEQKLGEGGFGEVYKGFIKELNCYVAVKKISRKSKQGTKEYASEVKIISRLRHKNLVQLIGWCHENKELLLVYEFMPHGSLDSHLFEGKTILTWVVRYNIAQGLASALFYLHEEWEEGILHRDIKASNIMLDSGFNAKLGDFGLARLVDHSRGSKITVLAGTFGYMAPECINRGKASKESDVYSFGVVALEIACGRRPIDPNAEENQIKLVEWVWELYGDGKLLEAADQKLCGEFDAQQMECLMIVGLWCAHPDYHLRPSMRQANLALNFEAPLPNLPQKIPEPTNFDTPLNIYASSCSTSSDETVAEALEIESSDYYHNSEPLMFMASSLSPPSVPLLHTM